MSNQKDLTNEKLVKQTANSFELVNEAIRLATHLIKSNQSGEFLSGGNQVYKILDQVMKEKRQRAQQDDSGSNPEKEIDNDLLTHL